MWESKAWDVANQLLSLVIITILAVLIWRTLDRIEAQGKANSAKQDATLDAIKERMTEESWQQVEKSLRRNK